MSLYKYGISDKTIGAMQNSDPEVQQMLENAQQNNQTQPPASNGIMDIIKELFGFGDAQSSDLGEIANLQSILNPITPEMGANLKYISDPSVEGGRRLVSTFEPRRDIGGAQDQVLSQDAATFNPLVPEVNIGATGTVPTLKEGILSQVDSRFPLYDDFTVAEEGDDLEDNAVTVDQLGNLKQPPGFKDFLKTMLGFAIPGAGLFMGDRSALQGIKSLNQRLRNTDFARSSSLMDYLDAKKYGGRNARDAAAARNMAQTRGIQKKIDTGEYRRTAADDVIDRGRGDRPGGANYSAPSKPSRTSPQSGMQAERTRSRDLGSMRGGVGR